VADSVILHRDEHLVAAAKPSGLLVHRGFARDRDVLMMRVRDAIGQYVYPLHRLDRGASGVVLFALTRDTARLLGDAFARAEIRKQYLALVRGIPAERGVIDHPVRKTERGIERVSAVTEYRLRARFGRYSVVELRPRTGRLHQIRRHLKHIACPIIGDVRYGKGEHNRHFRSTYDLHRLALHAERIELDHPVTGDRLRIDAPLPADLADPLARLAADYPCVRS
jgi:tRNA pseudouridine65 synthase